ncbi:phage-related late control gene protein (GPD-like) [Acinetobacter baumannii]|uniref:contractile injection system protein, VgrG/Pvc8 family n=1 Tax=Acinetobacter baumannii TaxID=470 RepID=UPI000DE716E0|nr:contractile injection system protein, VgrG/Pvc8 family [Acinetobacter baumannii]SSP36706.1 phage-related late control gene protein (GPD-like) [Acinetobacter baumannii]SSQ34105.1 phage-related late control gene protein (GPD-like) [Acinetobacter baumannii]SSQ39501.1 phage-related late control gene protein (GPD-like) [Acinetobacter baumannii]SVJ96313.1 phage-related late control gene protein (GPD-like) [Acinetobacter baumannii]
MLNQITNKLNEAAESYQVETEYPFPIYRLEVDGNDISPLVVDRLISLSIKDNRGLVVDSVDIDLDDSDGQLEIPPEGAIIQVWIGWSNTGLVDKGKYKVESVTHRGAPDVLSISAFSNDVSEGLKQKRERSFSNKTIQVIFETVGTEYALKTIVHDTLANRVISYIAQNESDANLITRIADEHDAIATVKNGHLILLPRGASQTVSGLPLPTAQIFRSDGDGHNYTTGTGTDRITGVKAFYYDAGKSKKLYVVIGDNEENLKEIRYVHRDKKTAELACQAEFNRCKRSSQKLTYTFAFGQPELIPEQEFVFTGLKPQIDDIVWLGTNVTHNLTEGGFTTSVELEVQLPNTDDVSTLFEPDKEGDKELRKQNKKRTGRNYADYTGVIVFYRENGKDQKLTSGDQSNPLKLIKIYKTKKTATIALKREQARIDKAKKGK